MEDNLYHVTTRKNFYKILKSGAILPLKGDNSNFNSEKEPAIYLCEFKDIWIWKIILGADMVLQIKNMNKSTLKSNKYFTIDDLEYKEHMSYVPIYIENLEQVIISYDDEDIDKNMDKLTRMSIIELNKDMDRIVRYSQDYSNIILQNKIKHNLRCHLRIYDKVDPEWISKNYEKVFTLLRRIANCGYDTFLDNIGNTGLKLYKILPMVSFDTPDKELSQLISNLYDWINEKFDKSILFTAVGMCDKFIYNEESVHDTAKL